MIAVLLLVLRLGLTAALYAFLGWALYTLWRDLQVQQASLAERQVPPLVLNVQTPQGPDVRHFANSPITIGRSRACECAIDDPTLSARHARLSYHHNQWWLEDLGSTNGTLLHEEIVTAPMVLASGDPITCGKVALTVEIENRG